MAAKKAPKKKSAKEMMHAHGKMSACKKMKKGCK